MFKLALVILAGFLLVEFSLAQHFLAGDKRFVLEMDLNTEVTNLKLAFAGLQNNLTKQIRGKITNEIRSMKTT